MIVLVAVVVLKSLLLILRHMVLCEEVVELVLVEGVVAAVEVEVEELVLVEEVVEEEELVLAEEEEEEEVVVVVVVHIAADVGCILHWYFVHSLGLRVLEDWLPILRLLVEEEVLRLGSRLEEFGIAVLHLVSDQHLDGHSAHAVVAQGLVQDHCLNSH
jgi:hypothetical protein